ncbi:MAG: DUF460 domain-containing protein [archaeon]
MSEEDTTRKYFFVGYDPGTTSAVALVDIDGKVFASKHERGMGETEVIRFIQEHGKPIVVASDVSPAPKKLEKLAARFDVDFWHPRESLPVEKKKELYAHKNAHIRDAAAAALNYYKNNVGKIRYLKKRHARDEVGRILREGIEPEAAPERVQAARKRTDVAGLLERMGKVEAERAGLGRRVEILERKVRERDAEIERLRKRDFVKMKIVTRGDESVRRRYEELKRREALLSGRVGMLRKMHELSLGGAVVVKVVAELSDEEIDRAGGIGIFRGDTVWVRKPGAEKPARRLAGIGVARVIGDGFAKNVLDAFCEAGVEVLGEDDVELSNDSGVWVLKKIKERVDVKGILEEYRGDRKGF